MDVPTTKKGETYEGLPPPRDDLELERLSNPGENLEFEQSRLDHCIRLFNEENSRRERFDKTAQYYLAFITAFLAALFLKFDFLRTTAQLLTTRQASSVLVLLVYSCVIIMLLCLFFSLICILECLRVRRYKREFPSSPSLRLFANDSLYAGHENSASFLRITAMTYAAAIEENFHITEKKGMWIARASLFVLTSVLSLFFLLAAVTYLTVP
jgi:hypothetical protein